MAPADCFNFELALTGSRWFWGRSGRRRFDEAHAAKVADDERRAREGGGDANGREHLVNGVGENERCGSRGHARLQDGLSHTQ